MLGIWEYSRQMKLTKNYHWKVALSCMIPIDALWVPSVEPKDVPALKRRARIIYAAVVLYAVVGLFLDHRMKKAVLHESQDAQEARVKLEQWKKSGRH
jgi:hypothetical protein